MILADKIIFLRKQNNWSQEQLAEHLGVSRQSVSKWESAMSMPDLDKIMKMSSLFGVSTDYLLKDEIETLQKEEVCENDGEKVNTLLIGSIFTCVAADGKFNDAEWQFISSFIGGYSYEEAFSVAGEFYNDEAQDIVRQLVELFPSDISEAFVSLCLAVLCVDGRVADYERYFLNKIL
jgi:transcriptional regulator with XRE-family HTH domain